MKNRMHAHIISILLLLSSTALLAKTATGTFFSVRSPLDSRMIQNLLLDAQHATGRSDKQRNTQFVVYGGQSRESQEIARYFFQGQEFLTVREDAPNGSSTAEVGQHILANDFGLFTDGNATSYEGEIKIAPRQTVIGGTFSLRGYMGKTQQWSYAIEVPVVYVENDLRFEEKSGTYTAADTTDGMEGTAPVASMEKAFKNDKLLYGRIDGKQKSKGLGNMVLKIGYEPCSFCSMDDKYMNTYIGVILPTDNKPKGKYMFEPMRGNNGHTGIVMGTQYEALMKSGGKYNLWARWNIESRYLMQNTQKRSFDLLGNGGWSRYLPMYKTAVDITEKNRTYGINLLTLDTKVRPGYQGMIDMAFYLNSPKWHASFGVTTFARQSERLELAQPWDIEPYIAAYANPDGTNRFRQSGREYVELETDAEGDVAIKQHDIDLQSATMQGGVSHQIYMTLGGYTEGEKPRMYELGASYEFASVNTALTRWGMWATLQYSF